MAFYRLKIGPFLAEIWANTSRNPVVLVLKRRGRLPRPKCSRGAVYTLLRLCRVYYKYTATRWKHICSVLVYCLCSAYTAPCSIPQCECSVLCTVCLQCMLPLNLQIAKSGQCTYRLPFTWQCKVYCVYSIY